MDKTRTLPPLVRGKVTGILDFFVDEIRLFRNILLLTDNFDLVLQLQWWGEVLPAYVRPKTLHIQDRGCENAHLIESYYHSVKYEIKTTLDLFKLYLKTCEVAELSILEAVENYVVGSAFLRDLIKLLNKNEVPEEEKKENKMTELYKNHFGDKKLNEQFVNIPSKVQSNFLSEKTIHYDGYSKKNVDGRQHIELVLPFDNYNFNNKKEVIFSPSESEGLNTKQKINVSGNPRADVGLSKQFPEVKTSNDSSKILYFLSNSRQSTVKPSFKKSSVKLTKKFNSNSIKDKSKPKSSGNISSEQKSCCTNLIKKKPERCRNLTTKSVTTEKDKQVDNARPLQQYTTTESVMEDKKCDTPLTTSRSETLSSKTTDLYGTPLKETSNVLDYLLGSDMSKDDEKTALNDFKQMSPSHNLVDSISQLCLIADKGVKVPENRPNPNASVPAKQGYLKFDFENPIERSYYEKFFMKTNTAADFEVAEFLNHPENRYMVGMSNADKTMDLKSGSESGSSNNFSKYSIAEKEEEGCMGNSFSGFDKKKNCARCKYYKKLDELDTIIESLKHFEEKMLSDGKQFQTVPDSDFVIRRNLTKDS